MWTDFVDLAIHEFVNRLGSPKLQRLIEDGLSLGNGQPRGDIENGWNEGRAHAETAEAQANQQDERAGRTGHFAAQGYGFSRSAAGGHDTVEHSNDGRTECLAEVVDFWVVSIGGGKVLHQVI